MSYGHFSKIKVFEFELLKIVRKMSSNFLICLFLGFSTQAKGAIELDLGVSSFVGGGQILPRLVIIGRQFPRKI